jgi:hypothetical protein
MKTRVALLLCLIASVFLNSGCAGVADGSNTKTQLSREEVIQIAEAIARSEGFDIHKYKLTGCHFEFTSKDRTWTVFFELKPPTPPGGHFAVSVDDQTKKATLMRGE